MTVIDTIAAEFGISRFTVARILEGRTKGRWGAARDRSQAIRAAAERLGWRPNTAAKAMRSGRFSAIGLVVRESRPHMNRDLCFAMMDRCEELGLSLHLVKMPEAIAEGSMARLRWLREHCLDGVAIDWSASMDPAILADIEATHDLVWINQDVGAAAVYPEERSAITRLTQRLIGNGFRRILFVDQSASWSGNEEPGRHYSHEARRVGYREAMHAAGLPDRLVELPAHHGDIAAAMDRLAQAIPLCDAMIVMHERAMARVHALTQGLAPSLPVFAIGDGPGNPWTPWTSFRQPWSEVGRVAVDHLTELIEGREPRRQAIEYDIEAIPMPRREQP